MPEEAKKETTPKRPLPDKKWLLLAALLLLITFAAGSRYGQYLFSRAEAPPALEAVAQEEESPPPTIAATTEIAVHVKGAVAEPGLYHFEQGMRVDDAVRAARALTEADLDRLNLAAALVDGGQVIVPYSADTAAAGDSGGISTSSPAVSASSKAAKTEALIQEAANDEAGDLIGAAEEPEAEPPTSRKININTASVEELQSLTGIGEAKAKAIVNYREMNGAFAYPEQIKRVSGIGEAIYLSIVGDICVE